jgi:formate dehydrogenase major subunit
MGYAMDYLSPEAVFAEFAVLTESYCGLTYAGLGGHGKLWPLPRPDAREEPVLFGDRFPTRSGRGKFVPCAFAPAKELPDADYPFVLNTGRLLEHWHTGTMTRRAAVLDALEPAPFVELNPADLTRLGLGEGERVTVRSRRGTITLRATAHPRVSEGSVFIPFHFREAAANLLTIDALDPDGKIPEFKFCAVQVERAAPT